MQPNLTRFMLLLKQRSRSNEEKTEEVNDEDFERDIKTASS